MGFRIDSHGVVHLDQGSIMYGDTRLSRNPTSAKTLCDNNPMDVHSLFLRRKNKTERRDVGDNCPLIYALKSKEGLRVTYSSIKPLVPLINDIIDKFVKQQLDSGVEYHAVVTVPSGHNIVEILAKQLAKRLRIPVENRLFRKASADDIQGQLLLDNFGERLIPQGARVNIMNAVSRANSEERHFSMSEVSTEYRKFVKPMILVPEEADCRYESVVLVDDVFASGSTLIHAKDTLFENGLCNDVSAVCLFSPLNGRIKRSR